MPPINKLGSMIVIASAAVGGIVGTFELGDRMSWWSADPALHDAAVAPVSAGAGSAEPEGSVAPPTDAAPHLSELERRIADRVHEELIRQGCAATVLDDLTATQRVTPAADATSGFDSVYIEGSVLLMAVGVPHRVRLVGTGKGPAAEAQAIEMVATQFSDQLAGEGQADIFCREE